MGEHWEEVARKKNDCITEAQSFAKYKGLVFRYPVQICHLKCGNKTWSFVEEEVVIDGM